MKIHTTMKQPLITPPPPTYLDNPTFDDEQLLLQQQPIIFPDDDGGGDNNQHLDSLSLRELPILTTKSTTPKTTLPISPRTSTSSDPTCDFFFEFLINNDDDLITSTADDVIFNGRLLPFTPHPPRRSHSFSSAAARLTRPQLTESPSQSSPLPTIRPSRSLNYRKLHHHHHNNHQHHHSKSKSKPKPKPKPKRDILHTKLPWYWLAFGLPVKMASEMELKDIKNRQFRRECEPPPATRDFSGGRSCSSSVSWKFLNVLSCKNHVTVDVNSTAPFRSSFML